MKMLLSIIFSFFSIVGNTQTITINEKYDLPKKIKETSGLLYYNGELYTHNDKGDDAFLYQIDTITGSISRSIEIINADHHDWEDISQDDEFVYIGDFGNNYGDRIDLKIYRINKNDLSSSNQIIANIISFSYEDQVDFPGIKHASNFDAEALCVRDNKLLVFTKNWLDYRTNLYEIPKTIGNHVAKKISSFNTNGLITGASYNHDKDEYFLCGYRGDLDPFLIQLSNFTGHDLLSGEIYSYPITSNIGSGSQTEGICYISNDRYYLSREKFKKTIGTQTFKSNQKLYNFNVSYGPNQIHKTVSKAKIKLFPNPCQDHINIQNYPDIKIKDIHLYGINGLKVNSFTWNRSNTINLENTPSGVYLVEIIFLDNTKQIIKINKSL